MKKIEIELDFLNLINQVEVGDKISWEKNGIEKEIGLVSRIIEGKVFGIIDKEYISELIKCNRVRFRDKKPNHPLTKAFI